MVVNGSKIGSGERVLLWVFQVEKNGPEQLRQPVLGAKVPKGKATSFIFSFLQQCSLASLAYVSP